MDLQKAFIEAGVIKHGHFKLASGRHSDQYVNKDAIYSTPDLFGGVIRLLAGSMSGSQAIDTMPPGAGDVIAGPAVAGAVLAAPIAYRTGKIFVYPEKVAYFGLGFENMGEDPYVKTEMQLRCGHDKVVEGKSVILIEDIITTGGSVRETIECIYKAGGRVVEVRCIWNRGEHSEIGFAPVGCSTKWIPIHSLINAPVDSWAPEECPTCQLLKQLAIFRQESGTPGDIPCPTELMKGVCFAGNPGCEDCKAKSYVPLTDPKTGEVTV